MRLLAVAAILTGLLLPMTAAAQFRGYFDISHVLIPDLKEPD